MAWGLLAPLLYFVDSFWGPSPQVLLVPGSGHHQCQACPHGEAHGSGAGLFLRTNSTMWPPHTGSWALPSSSVRAGANADCSWVSFDSFLPQFLPQCSSLWKAPQLPDLVKQSRTLWSLPHPPQQHSFPTRRSSDLGHGPFPALR